MDADAAVVFDKAELAEAIHEEADAGAGGADHLCQSFLRDGRKQVIPFTRLTKLGQEQENSRQTPFAGVEKLSDKIGLGSHAPRQQKPQVHFGEGALLVHHAYHLSSLYPERCTEINGAGSGHVEPTHARQRLISNELAGEDKRDGGLFAIVRNHGELCAASPKIEDRVSRTSLRKEDLPGLQVDNPPSHSCFFKKRGELEGQVSRLEREGSQVD
jgi:hypothetical protein